MGNRPPIYRSEGFLGNIKAYQRNPLNLLRKAHDKCGNIVGIPSPLGITTSYLLVYPEYIKHVFLDNHKNYSNQTRGIKLLKIGLGDGILTSEGRVWKKQRDVGMKIFSNKNVEGMFDRKKEVITEVLSKWEIYEKKNTVIDLKSELSKMTIQITLEVFFMIKTSPENISEIYNMFRKSTQKINERLERILLAPYWLPTSFNRESWRAQQKVENYVFSLLKEIKSKYGSNKDYIFYDALFDCDKGAYSKKRNKQEMHRLLTYLVTGYKTVATAITWAFYLLMKYPEYEKKLYNEVCACDKICVSRLKELKFLDQIVNETLRVYPPFWLICRKAKRDDEIDGFKIRKGSTVMVSPYLTHRLKEFWTDPERFWPERFDFQQNKKSCLDAFMPFGIGPRTCLGRTFALQEIKLIIMMIMRKFRCEYVSKEQVDAAPLFELTQKGPVKVKLISR